MSQENNIPKKTDEITNTMRGLCAKRATTMVFMMDEAKKAGLHDVEYVRRAIRSYGSIAGEDIKNAMRDPSNMQEFAQHFAVGLDRDIYEMETVALDDDKYHIDFHYCPYVAQWEKLSRDPEEIALLCDIAMDGDRGIGDCFEDFQFTLQDTIAKGCDVCQIRFDRIKK